MELFWIAVVALILISVFIITNVFALLFLLKENTRLAELAERNSPPF
jgi:hypothetical protein